MTKKCWIDKFLDGLNYEFDSKTGEDVERGNFFLNLTFNMYSKTYKYLYSYSPSSHSKKYKIIS